MTNKSRFTPRRGNVKSIKNLKIQISHVGLVGLVGQGQAYLLDSVHPRRQGGGIVCQAHWTRGRRALVKGEVFFRYVKEKLEACALPEKGSEDFVNNPLPPPLLDD